MIATHPKSAQDLFEALKNIKVGGDVCVYSMRKCEELIPLVNEINELKEEKNAVILVHSYVTPDIMYGVGDHIGDSYALAKRAMETDADKIVFAAVRFMGETAKILNPQKEVLLPGLEDGCTLADAITGEEVRALKEEFPEYTFICYVNTTAEVKAESDVCVTSGNVYDVVENYPSDKIYFLPDKLMGENLKREMKKRGVKKDIKYYLGTCYVHEAFEPEEIFRIRTNYPEAIVVAHPECKPEVCEQAHFVGSTAQMLDFMKTAEGKQFLMLTECGLSARLQTEFPDKEFVGSCTLCKYMKSNTLSDILRVLKNPTERDRVVIDEDTRLRAAKSLEAMFRYTKK